MKQLIVIGSKDAGTKNDAGSLAQSLQGHGLEAEVKAYYWEDLVFSISDDSQSVIDAVSGVDIASVDLVIAVNWYKTGAAAFYRDMAFTLALYLQKAGTEFWNSEMLHQRSTTKLSAMMQLAQQGIPIPKTVFSVDRQMLLGVKGINFPLVVKTIAGSRGSDNHLVRNTDELQEILANNGDIPYMVEEYVPNDHDLRIVCYGGQPALVIKRRRADSRTHLNNTSQGASAETVPLAEVDTAILEASRKACQVLGREIAGVDIVLANDGSRRMVCLEVNAIPQLTSGSYIPEKAASLADALNEYMKGTI